MKKDNFTKIEYALRERNVSFEDLQKLLETSKEETFGIMYCNRATPEQLIKIAKEYNISLDYLCGLKKAFTKIGTKEKIYPTLICPNCKRKLIKIDYEIPFYGHKEYPHIKCNYTINISDE